MKHSRTSILFRVCLTLACLCFPATGHADEFLDDNLYYWFESGSVTDTRVWVTGVKNTSATHIVIPSTVVYEWQEQDGDGEYQTRSRTCSVTGIGRAFQNCSTLTSITIPDNVTSIADQAFSCCTDLESMTIGNGVTSIPDQAFFSCSSLASVTIPNSVTSIGRSAFNGCTHLESVTIGNRVTIIGSYAFSSCSGLASITIPDSVTSIGERAFGNCSSLASVTINGNVANDWFSNYAPFFQCTNLAQVSLGNGMTKIGSYMFYNLSSLESVTIGNLVTIIGISAFSSCSCLASVTIPDSVTSIGDAAFSSCSGLSSVTIPDSVTSIGGSAFQNCSSLATVMIGSGVTSIGNNAFWGCGSLTSFSLASGNRNYKSANGLLLTKDGTTLIRGVNGDVTIPDGVTNICAYAFNRCTDLTSVVIPDSVQLLANTAFDGCDKLWTSWYRTLANQAAGAGGSGGSGGGSGGSSASRVSMTVTNVVLHYVTQSVPSGAVVPPLSSGLVNVVTEVGAGRAVAIPTEWAEQYPGFEAAFGSDFREAVTQPTGKRDGSGSPMFVWQDFVAGTDPTDPDDVFTASITFDAATGEPVVSWSPELSAAEAAKRVYRIYGKVRLADADWTLLDGDAGDYNFFKVAVEMK